MWRTTTTSYSALLLVLGLYMAVTFLLLEGTVVPATSNSSVEHHDDAVPPWSLDPSSASASISSLQPSNVRGAWPILANESETLQDDPHNCCGPWKCSYYSKSDFDVESGAITGPPLLTVVMSQLASDWQKKPGFRADGIPQSNFTIQSKFVMQCTTVKDFVVGGRYKFVSFAALRTLQVDMTRVERLRNSNSSFRMTHPPSRIAHGKRLTFLHEQDIPLVQIGDSFQDPTTTSRRPRRQQLQPYQIKVTADTGDRHRSVAILTWIQVQDYVVPSTTTTSNSLSSSSSFLPQILPSRSATATNIHEPTMEHEIACMISSECHGRRTVCHDRINKGLSLTEAPWGLCKDYVPTTASEADNSSTRHQNNNNNNNNKSPPPPCLVYSVGIRDAYSNEELMGREGCEVHAFDCTVHYETNLAPNVTFHPWCLGNNASELKLDGTLGRAKDSIGQEGHEFVSFSEIVRRLGHSERELTVLKMDCEGCEWNGLLDLIQQQPTFTSRIRMLLLEMHLITTSPRVSNEQRQEELQTIRLVSRFLANYRTYRASLNPDASLRRFQEPSVYYKQLYPAGVHIGACCYEFAMVRKDLAHVANDTDITIVR